MTMAAWPRTHDNTKPPRGGFIWIECRYARREPESAPAARVVREGRRASAGDPRPGDRGVRAARVGPHEHARDREGGRRDARRPRALLRVARRAARRGVPRVRAPGRQAPTGGPGGDAGGDDAAVRRGQPRGGRARPAVLHAGGGRPRGRPSGRARVRDDEVRSAAPGPGGPRAPNQQAGRIRADLDPEAIAALVIAASDGLQTQWLLDPDAPQDAALLLLEQLLSRP